MAIDVRETRRDVSDGSLVPAGRGVITAVDVGTTKVCTIVGRRDGANGVEVLAHSVVPSDGLRKGNVYDVNVSARAIRASIAEVEEETGLRFESAYIGVTGSHLRFENRRDKLETSGGVITSEDLNAEPSGLKSASNEPGRKVIHAIRMAYSLDGDSGIRNPVGMHGRDVQVDTHLVTGATSFVANLVEAVEKAGVKAECLVLEPLASGMAVLAREEKERGALVVDIGGGTTDVVAFKRGRICYTGVIPVGGHQFTNDIAVTFNTPQPAAEAVKLEYAHTEIPVTGANEEISLPVVDRDVELLVRRLDICRLTRERAQELIRLIGLKVDEARQANPSAARLVLTGGASNLPGLADLMQKRLALRVRHGVPNGHASIPPTLRDSAYATGVGILLWAATESNPATPGPDVISSNGTVELEQRGFLATTLRRLAALNPVGLFSTRKGRS